MTTLFFELLMLLFSPDSIEPATASFDEPPPQCYPCPPTGN